MMKSRAGMQKDRKKIRHTSGGTILYQHVQPYFVLDERVVSRNCQARTSHDANYLLKSYMKDSRFPEPIKCLKTHASCCTKYSNIYEMLAVIPGRPIGSVTSDAKDPRTLPVSA